MKSIGHVVTLMVVIVVCAILSAIAIRPSESYSEASTYGCIAGVIEELKKMPSYQGFTNDAIYTALRQGLKVSTEEFLRSQGVVLTTLPSQVRSELPVDIDLIDLMSYFKRNVLLDELNRETPTNEWIIPINILLRFASQKNDGTVRIQETPLSDRKNPESVFYNDMNKQCIISNLKYRTNLNQLLPDDLNKLNQIDPRTSAYLYQGCKFPYENRSIQSIRDDLQTMYLYSDVENVQRYRDIVRDYAKAVQVKDVATITNNIALDAKAKADAAYAAALKRESDAQATLMAKETALKTSETTLATSASNKSTIETRVGSKLNTMSM